MSAASLPLEKLETGIPGFDLISFGGLPKGRTTLVSGTAGSAKTILAAQFLAEGIRKKGQSGCFVTFEESPEDIRRNLCSLGWDIEQWEREGRWIFVDGSPHVYDEAVVVGDYDLDALLYRIEHAVKKVNAERLSMDSIGAIFLQFGEGSRVRRELYRITAHLKTLGVTSIITREREDDQVQTIHHGVEEFVTDNVIILRNAMAEEKRRRTMEILKFRGALHQKGQFPFTISPDEGIILLPLSAIELKQRSSNIRIGSGITELDEMCGGGFFRDSIVLVSGATGTGKTLTATQFLAGGISKGERALLFAFEESREQLFRNASGWGLDFEQMERDGQLMVVCEYPEVASLEDHLLQIKNRIVAFKPNRVAIDSLSALERVSTMRSFREFVIGLTSYIKHQEVAGLMTATTPTLLGGASITEAHISTVTDSIILLRYVESFGEMRRGLTVLKMRGSFHDKDIREFKIDSTGIRIGAPFRNVSGILSGNFMQVSRSELEGMRSLFSGDDTQG